jgi:hypothetical protein
MFHDGYRLMRARLARENTNATERQLDAMMQAWLLERNGVGDRRVPDARPKGRSKPSRKPARR